MTRKVLYIINDLAIGGSEMMLWRLLSRIDRKAFEPSVLSLMKQEALRERLQALDIRVVCAGARAPLPSFGSIREVLQVVREVKPDLIQGWMYHANLAATFARKFSKTSAPVVWGIRNSLSKAADAKEKVLTSLAIKIGARISHLPNAIVYVSEASRLQHEAYGYKNPNSYVIANGFEVGRCAPAETRAEVRRELGIKNDDFLIALIGRFHPVKDHSNFLRAASILVRNHPKARFLLCGTRVDNDNPILNEMVTELGIRDQVLLLGERHDVPRLILASDVLALSSYNEASPGVIGEAMSAAIPCVATDVGDVRRVLGETGIVVPARDAAALAKGLETMVLMEHQQRLKLGHAARERIKEHFSLDSAARQYEELYAAAINAAPYRNLGD